MLHVHGRKRARFLSCTCSSASERAHATEILNPTIKISNLLIPYDLFAFGKKIGLGKNWIILLDQNHLLKGNDIVKLHPGGGGGV